MKEKSHLLKQAHTFHESPRKKGEVSEHVRNDNLWHIVAVEAQHFCFSRKKCNSRQILRALNDLTNEWSFLLLVLSDVGVSEGYDNKHKKDFFREKVARESHQF